MTIDICAHAISYHLLEHNGLMTPVLCAVFGEIFADGIEHSDAKHSLRRVSTLRQKSSGSTLLNAVLDIKHGAVPVALVEQLHSSIVPFGELLRQHGIRAIAQNKRIFHKVDEDTGQTRWGRQLNLCDASTLAVICDVEELLAPEKHLSEMALSS